jgi:magnesium and cobalt transporter
MVHIKDLFYASERGELSPDFREIRRDVLFFPERAKLVQVLRAFQAKRSHLAILVDEYGATVGMITLENVLEELVGDIQDEFDDERPPIRALCPGEYRVDAMCPLELFKEVFDFERIDSTATTVGGLVFERCGHLPERGESVSLEDDRFVVDAVEGQRIDMLRFLTARRARWPKSDSDADAAQH